MTTRAAVEAVSEVFRQLNDRSGTVVRLLLCGLWSDPPSASREVLDLVRQLRPSGIVVGMDVAGDETHPNRAGHLEVLAEAKRGNIPFTVHAGEGAGADSVRETPDLLAPTRIGHGVPAIEDPALLSWLSAAGTHLELCPSCNIQLGLYPDLTRHPIFQFAQAGVSVSISTDQRTITDTTLTNEYERLALADPSWTVERLHALTVSAMSASFAEQPLKDELCEQLHSWSQM
jgi:adenosine deaminase